MAEIVLVRHGQANSQATDEASYDRLSQTGHRQAAWLGAHLRDTNPHFDHVIIGDMRRHRETAQSAGFDATEVDPRWNELSYFALSTALQAKTGTPFPAGGDGFRDHVDAVFRHWRAQELAEVPETYTAFETRVQSALAAAVARGGRTLVITSTGVIAMLLRGVLDLGHEGHMKVILQTANTSMHRLEALHGHLYLAEFGATPHLDSAERRRYRTYY